MAITGNDFTKQDAIATRWWSGEVQWHRPLWNMVLGRLRRFDRHVD